MKKLFFTLFLLGYLVNGRADFIDHILVNPVAGFGGTYLWNSTLNCWTNNGTTSAGIQTMNFTNSSWQFWLGFTNELGYTTNSLAIPTNTTIYLVYTNGILATNSGYQINAEFFVTPSTNSGDLVLYSNSLASFWSTNGSAVQFNASGFNNSAAMSNVVKCSFGTNNLLTSLPTAGRGNPWRMTGNLRFNGSNLVCYAQYSSGDSNASLTLSYVTITNATITNQPFILALAGGYDTNLTLINGGISSAIVIPPATTPASLSFAPIQPGLFQPPFTVTNSSDSTYGFGAGLMRWDTNFFYLSVGTNSWRRVAVSSW